jgi:hypothetical protein
LLGIVEFDESVEVADMTVSFDVVEDVLVVVCVVTVVRTFDVELLFDKLDEVELDSATVVLLGSGVVDVV